LHKPSVDSFPNNFTKRSRIFAAFFIWTQIENLQIKLLRKKPATYVVSSKSLNAKGILTVGKAPLMISGGLESKAIEKRV
jgi:hypothetical protein